MRKDRRNLRKKVEGLLEEKEGLDEGVEKMRKKLVGRERGKEKAEENFER